MLAGAWIGFMPALPLDGFPPLFTTVITFQWQCSTHPCVSQCLHNSSLSCPSLPGCWCCRQSPPAFLQRLRRQYSCPNHKKPPHNSIHLLELLPRPLLLLLEHFRWSFLFTIFGSNKDVCCKPSYVCLQGMRYLIGFKDALY